MSAVFTPTRYKISVEDYQKLGEAGVLGEDSRVELIEGELIQMTPIGARHAGTVSRLHDLLYEQIRDLALVWQQNPVTLPPGSEPQPDLMLLKHRADHYVDALPTAADVLLIIEVSDTSLEYDRGEKLRLYGSHGIGEYWIVDLPAQRFEVYRQPVAAGYASRLELGASDNVSPLAFSNVRISVASVFG
jgi:Uma2 family endonuclease